MPTNVKSILYQDANSNPIQVLPGAGVRANLTAGVATSRVALPAGAAGSVVLVRSTDYFWLAFGTVAINATADLNSILCPPGEGAYYVPASATHYAGLRVGGTDVITQVESVATV